MTDVTLMEFYMLLLQRLKLMILAHGLKVMNISEHFQVLL